MTEEETKETNHVEAKLSHRFILEFPKIDAFIVKSVSIPTLQCVDEGSFKLAGTGGAIVVELYGTPGVEKTLSELMMKNYIPSANLFFLDGAGIKIGKYNFLNTVVSPFLSAIKLDYHLNSPLVWTVALRPELINIKF